MIRLGSARPMAWSRLFLATCCVLVGCVSCAKKLEDASDTTSARSEDATVSHADTERVAPAEPSDSARSQGTASTAAPATAAAAAEEPRAKPAADTVVDTIAGESTQAGPSRPVRPAQEGFPWASMTATGLDTMRQAVTSTVRVVLRRIATEPVRDSISLAPGHFHVFTRIADTTTICMTGADSSDFRIRSLVPSNRRDLTCGTQMVNRGDEPTPWTFAVMPLVRGDRTVDIQVFADHAAGPSSVQFDTTYAIHVEIGPQCYGSGCAWYQRWFDIAMGSEGAIEQTTAFAVALAALITALGGVFIAIRRFGTGPGERSS